MGIPVSSEPPSRCQRAIPLLFIGGETVTLTVGDTIVGRSPKAAVMIADPPVSRRHAVIHVGVDRAELADMRSKNGIFVGDDRVKIARVKWGHISTRRLRK